MTHPAPPTLVVGAAGTVGQVLVAALAPTRHIIALDPRPMSFDVKNVEIVQGSVSDQELLTDVLTSVGSVLHLATAGQSWPKLMSVEVAGSRNLFQLAVQAGVRRVVAMSSNHVVGGYERDLLLGSSDRIQETDLTILRPDSEYAAAKVFIEAYGRYIAETTNVGVSCVRLGTVRPIDDPARYSDAPEFSYIPGGREARLRRLRATWLYHDDLAAMTTEELEATESFRIRFGVSDNPGRYWPLDVCTWDSQALSGARFESA